MITVFNKKSFIAWCEENIEDDKAVVFSLQIESAEIKKKRGAKVVSMTFATDSFKVDDGIGDIYKGDVIPILIGICDKKELSEKGQGICERSNG